MALTETVRDIENYPSKSKTVTLDVLSIIPIDTQGDEKFVANASSTATKIGGGTIDPIFIREFKVGYAKSSGFVLPPFDINSSNNKLSISIDGSSAHEITLSSGTGLTGEDIASDLQTKLSSLAAVSGAEDRNLAFLNCSVEFVNNKLIVLAGSVSNTYTGVGKSSVSVAGTVSGSADVTLGFDKPVSSEDLSSKLPHETILTSGYAISGVSLSVESISGLSAGMAFSIYDGTNREYFIASGIGANSIGVQSTALTHVYSTGSIVQRIFERDPGAKLASPYEDIDSLYRFALRSIANQINFAV